MCVEGGGGHKAVMEKDKDLIRVIPSPAKTLQMWIHVLHHPRKEARNLSHKKPTTNAVSFSVIEIICLVQIQIKND